jgi:hypothetical protein
MPDALSVPAFESLRFAVYSVPGVIVGYVNSVSQPVEGTTFKLPESASEVHVVVPPLLWSSSVPVANVLPVFAVSALNVAKVPEPPAATVIRPTAQSNIRYRLAFFDIFVSLLLVA